MHRALGSPVPLEVGGVVGMLHPMTLSILGSVEALILHRRSNPVDQAADVLAKGGYPADVAKRLMNLAYEEVKRDRALRVARLDEVQQFLGTLEGLAFIAWQCFDHPDFTTLSSSRGPFQRASDPFSIRFARARDLVSGCDLLANLDWPEASREQGGPGKFIPWRRILRYFADQHGWGPDQIGALTLYGLNIYMCEESSLGGTKRLSLSEYRDRFGSGETPGTPGRRATKRLTRELTDGQ